MASTQQQSGTAHLPTEQLLLEFAKQFEDPSSTLPRELPGFDSLIRDWFDENKPVTQEHFCRRALKLIRDSTHGHVYKKGLQQYPQEHQDAINAFIDGTLHPLEIESILSTPATSANRGSTPGIRRPITPNTRLNKRSSPRSSTASVRKIHQVTEREFNNWGETLQHINPETTYYPETIDDVQAIVKDSVENGKGVRVSGYRHSWAPVFGRKNRPNQRNNGDVMISMLPERIAGDLPNVTALPGSIHIPEPTELNQIKKVHHTYVKGPELTGGKQYVRVGAATTNESFRRWCLTKGRVTLPMNIIEVEITMGGANAPICHGAGIKHATLSDLVRAIEYVDVNGERQKVNVSDGKLLKAAAGCFGLLGVVTHITYECDPIATAVMRPVKLDLFSAIPPPPEWSASDLPKAIRSRMPSQEQRAKDQKEFERRANDDYYAEWFWFPYSEKVWVNTWSIDEDTSNVQDYPGACKTTAQVVLTMLGNLGQILLGHIDLLAHFDTAAMTFFAMVNLPEVKENKPAIRTLIPNALHFQRGVTNIRVRDLEVEFPIHLNPGTQNRDYTNVQEAWWQAIRTCYEHHDTCPQRMPLEMRIMGGSDVIMAPQRGHTNGTCSIEILTLHASADIWPAYAQKVLDKWMDLKDIDGNQLMVRPHWAKEWRDYKVREKPWLQVLKEESYVEEIAEFKRLLAEIGEKQNWTLADIKSTFSNELFDELYFDDIEASPRRIASPSPVPPQTPTSTKTRNKQHWTDLIMSGLVTIEGLIKMVQGKIHAHVHRPVRHP